jgi:hypothetical protein
MCQEDDVRRFFSTKVPKPTVKRDFVARALLLAQPRERFRHSGNESRHNGAPST